MGGPGFYPLAPEPVCASIGSEEEVVGTFEMASCYHDMQFEVSGFPGGFL
jgi:hypothetical protein